MFQRAAAAAVLALAGSLPVWSATIQSNIENFQFSSSQALNFTQFDPSLGTLTGVTLALLPGSEGLAQGVPTNPIAPSYCTGSTALSMGVNSDADLLGFVLFDIISYSDSHCLFSAPQVHSTPIDRLRSLDSLGLGQFEGAGTVPVTLTQSAVFTNVAHGFTFMSGTAQLTYTYDPVVTETVPEPSTWGLLAAGLAMGIRARRTRR